MSIDLRDRIRDVPDFPSEGIVFKDLMPLIADPQYFAETDPPARRLGAATRPDADLRRRGARLHLRCRSRVCPGSRVHPARKPGKLPRETIEATYALEYGTDSLQVHRDAVTEGARVDRSRRRARNGGNRQREDGARRGARRSRGRRALRDRARVPARARALCPDTTCIRSFSIEPHGPSGATLTTRAWPPTPIGAVHSRQGSQEAPHAPMPVP